MHLPFFRHLSFLSLATLTMTAQAERTIEIATEVAVSSDVSLWQTSEVLKYSRGSSQYSLSLSASHIKIDYQPVTFDFQGKALPVREKTLAAQSTVRHRTGRNLTLLGSAGIYDGFTSYRSLWLDEYYRQQYAAATSLRNYRPANPRGLNASAGIRWEYLPATGFIQANFAWLSDHIAPGYEIDFNGLRRGAETLHTTALELAFENIVTPHVRTLLTLRAADTSGRETRFGFEYSANYALGKHGTIRGTIGGTREQPTLTARFASLALERKISDGVFLAVTGHVYRDTGEIENALLFTSAAPALTSRQWGLALRGEHGRFSWRVSFAPLATRYAATNRNTDFFQNLYRDRNWTMFQAAIAVVF